MQRSAMRELAFKLIYEIEMQNEDEEFEIFIENNEITDEKVIEYLKDIKSGTKEHSEEINDLITTNLKQNWSNFIQWWCKKEKINGWNLECCKISYKWFFPDNRRRDADNFGLANKFICDGLVKAEVIKDDCLGKLWLEYDCHKYVDKENPRVEVTIEELKDFEEIKIYTKKDK